MPKVARGDSEDDVSCNHPCLGTTKTNGTIKYSETLNILKIKDSEGKNIDVCTVRNSEIELCDSKNNIISSWVVPYGAKLHVKDGKKVKYSKANGEIIN